MDKKAQTFLGKIGKLIAESATSVFPMLIPKPAEVELGEISEWKPEACPESMVLLTTSFNEGPSGSKYFLFSSKNAAVVVDLMLGGEGTDGRSMDEEAKDALKEAMNQLIDLTAQNMRERYNSPVGLAQVDVHGLEPGIDLNLLLGDDPVYRIDYIFKIEGKDPGAFSCCLPQETLSSLQKELSEGKAAAPPAEPEKTAVVEDSGAVAQAIKTPISHPKMVEAEGEQTNVSLILDIEMPIIIRLGTAEMTLHEILRLGPGAIIELNKNVDEPVELLVNDKVLARGEIVVVEGNFAFRVTEVVSKSIRIQSLA